MTSQSADVNRYGDPIAGNCGNCQRLSMVVGGRCSTCGAQLMPEDNSSSSSSDQNALPIHPMTCGACGATRITVGNVGDIVRCSYCGAMDERTRVDARELPDAASLASITREGYQSPAMRAQTARRAARGPRRTR